MNRFVSQSGNKYVTLGGRLGNVLMNRLIDVETSRRWLTGRRGATRLATWTLSHPELNGWTVDELLTPDASHRTDAMQAALVAVAQAGDGDAALLLLTQLRPGLNRIVNSAAGPLTWSRAEAVDEVRASFYETLYRHSLDRRPRKIAANLVLDTRQRVMRWQTRWHRFGSAPFGPVEGRRRSTELDAHEDTTIGCRFEGAVDPIGASTALAAVTGAIGDALDRLPGDQSSRHLTADLAYRAWVLEQPRYEIASDLGLGVGNVSTRLHRLKAALDIDEPT